MLNDKQYRRFWNRVKVSAEGCWEWTAGLSPKGYGQFKVLGAQARAHRVAFELYNGPIPDGMCVLHSCDNRKCVRKDHLRLGTQRENIDDRQSRARQAVKFDASTIARVHELKAQGWRQRWIARELLMSEAYVSIIVNGYKRAYTH